MAMRRLLPRSTTLLRSSSSIGGIGRYLFRRLSSKPPEKLPSIIYTHTDEAPVLATYSFLPIVRHFLASSGLTVDLFDISLSNRILAEFYPEKERNYLEELREIVQLPEANIIKLPNISASVPQLLEAVNELRTQGYDIPDYNPHPQNEEEKEALQKFDRVLGSVVNPVLREGNSDRRVATPVKHYAQKHPHRYRLLLNASFNSL